MAKKPSVADQMENEIRQQYLPAQLQASLNEILAIEFNNLWRQTPEGIQAAKDEHGLDPSELGKVLIKQAAHKETLQKKVDFIKRQINNTKK